MIIGLTGGICSGKSTAASWLAGQGVRIIDADEIARFLTLYSSGILAGIRDHFGESVFHKHGALNRKALASIVFADAAQRQALNTIVHPEVIAIQRENIAYARSLGQNLVLSVPLLIEAGEHTSVDEVWVISCSYENQLTRLMERDGISWQDARARIDSQMPLSEKLRYADRVIENNGTVQQLQDAVESEFAKVGQADA